MAALTVRLIEAIRPRDKPFKVTIDRGLQLRVAPDGRRTLLVRYTVKGYPDERQYSLPREYGDGPGQIKLAEAKAEAARGAAVPDHRCAQDAQGDQCLGGHERAGARLSGDVCERGRRVGLGCGAQADDEPRGGGGRDAGALRGQERCAAACGVAGRGRLDRGRSAEVRGALEGASGRHCAGCRVACATA